jgi:two-component sensor histidine kinase/CHASE3 domain sensor protein
MSKSSKFLLRSSFAFLFVGFMALMAIVAMNFWLSKRAQSIFEDAGLARDTRIAAVELRNAMQTAEASQRGFVITGNEIYLAPYQAAKIQAQHRLSALQLLLPAYAGAGIKLERLESLLASKFDELDRTIALKRDKRDEEVLAIIRTNSGKALTDEANVFFSGIIGQADDKLTSGLAEENSNTAWLRLVSGGSAFLIIVFVGSAAYGITRYTKELQTAGDEVSQLNAELEERVATRTADLAHARDRAEVLLSEVNHRVANSLALVSSLVSLQSKVLIDKAAKSALAETQDRIFAISLVHKRLYDSADVRAVELSEYLSGLLEHLRTSLRSEGQGVTLSFNIEPIELETDASINLGVIVTELVTNAFKYAYPDRMGEIRVSVTKRDEQIELLVEDDGVGRAEGAPAKGTGVGTRIVNAMSASLGARIEYKVRDPGTAACLVFLPKLKRAAEAQ